MPYIISAVIILLFIVILFTFAIVILNSAGVNKRCDGDENLKYLKAKNFDNLNALPINFKSDKGQTLNGFLYSSAKVDTYKGLIVFSHGMGAGHLAYTTEINYFAQKGYVVLGYDNTGCCTSEGKKIKGFAQGIIDLKYALKFVKTREEVKDLPILLVGHSWGAYSVSNVSSLKPDVDIKGIVAFSPFNSMNKLIRDIAKRQTKINLSILSPFFDIINLLRFGKAGILRSCDSINSNSIPTLVLHGGNDMQVTIKNSPVGKKHKVKDNPNARTVLYENKYHNVYLAKDAEQYLNDTFAKIESLGKNSPEAYEVYQNIDYTLITKEDLSVMETVSTFLEECAMKRDFLTE
ncbi:MAG: alpha/beta fold hydrolase [Clostridia bacterium]|nr:alpha/beta fold hydrolase [Clostridia bacterium]